MLITRPNLAQFFSLIFLHRSSFPPLAFIFPPLLIFLSLAELLLAATAASFSGFFPRLSAYLPSVLFPAFLVSSVFQDAEKFLSLVALLASREQIQELEMRVALLVPRLLASVKSRS